MFKNSTGKPSIPGDLSFFIFFMAYEISSAVNFPSSCFEVLSSNFLIFLSSIIDDMGVSSILRDLERLL